MGDKVKTLSQALRLGATYRPQARRAILDKKGRSCALGAIAEGIGLDIRSASDDPFEESAAASSSWTSIRDTIHARFPALDRPQGFICPVCETRHDLEMLIIHLNDSHAWTREHIADWLEVVGL